MKKIYFLSFFVFLFFAKDICSQTITIGNGTNGNYELPLNTFYRYSYSQQIYTAAEIIAANGGSAPANHSISEIAFPYFYATSQTKNNVTILLGNITNSAFASATSAAYISHSNMSVCFFGSINFNNSNGNWTSVELNDPFLWDGISNIVVCVINNHGDYTTSTNNTFYTHNTSSIYQAMINYIDGSTPYATTAPPAATPTRYTKKNNIKFTFQANTTCPKVLTLSITGITGTSAVVNWTAPPGQTQWLLSYKKTSELTWSNEVLITAPTMSYTLSGLTSTTEYNVRIRSICGVGDTSDYRTGNFITTMVAVNLPYYENFEGSGSLYFYNGTSTNHWVTGSASAAQPPGSTRSLYISNNSATPPAHSYTITSAAYVYAVQSINFPAGECFVNYDWHAYGENNYDYLQVWLAPATANFTAGSAPTTTNWINLYGSSNLCLQSSWQHVENTITIPTAAVYYLVFYWRNDASGGTNPPAAIDNIEVFQIACSRPTAINITNITGTSAVVNWTAPPGQTQWLLSYKKTSELTWSNEVLITAPTMSYTLSGLTSTTEYNVRIRSICGVGDTSNYKTDAFSTTMIAVNLPYYENFEGSGSLYFYNGTSTNHWVTGSASSAQPPGSTRSLYISNNSATPPAHSYTITSAAYVYAVQSINFPAGECFVNYDWHAYGENNYDYLQVWLAPATANFTAGSAPTTTNWINLYGSSNLCLQSSWQHVENTITIPAAAVYYLVFYWRNDASLGTDPPAAIDNIEVFQIACSRPTAINITNITGASAVVNWTAPPGQTQWLLSYKKTSELTWSNEVLITAPTMSYTLSGLTSTTEYNVRIRSICGVGDTSNYKTDAFSTTMIAVNLPYYENFEEGGTLYFYNGTSTNHWVTGSASSAQPPGSTRSLYISNNSATPPAHSYTTTSTAYVYAVRSINFPAGECFVNYDWHAYGESGFDYLQVWLAPATANFTAGSAPTTTNWINLYGSSNLCLQSSWQHVETSVTIPAAAVYYLVFYWRNDASLGTDPPAAVDNIEIFQPACSRPVTINVTNISASSAVVNWTATPEQTQWLLSYKAIGEPTWSNEVLITAPAMNYTLSGLTSTTEYNVRIRTICPNGTDTSSYKQTSFITTLVPVDPPYYEDFEQNPSFLFYQGTSPNHWVVGSAPTAVNSGNKALYVSNDNATPPTYAFTSSTTNCFALKTINLAAASYLVNFDWKSKGYNSSDFCKIYLAPSNAVITGGTDPVTTGWILISGGALTGQTTWQHCEQVVDVFTPGVYQIVFHWKNGSYTGNPPCAIDNFSIVLSGCQRVSNLDTSFVNGYEIHFNWQPGDVNNLRYIVQLKADIMSYWYLPSDPITATQYVYQGLYPNTLYNVRVKAFCADDAESTWAYINVRTHRNISVDDIENENILIYPNPANDILNIKMNANYHTITIFNVYGQKIEAFNTDGLRELYIDLSKYSAGLFFVKFNNSKENITKKFIKE